MDIDLFVGRLQEMESGKDAYVRYDPAKENAWVKAIFKALGDKSEEYYKVRFSCGWIEASVVLTRHDDRLLHSNS